MVIITECIEGCAYLRDDSSNEDVTGPKEKLNVNLDEGYLVQTPPIKTLKSYDVTAVIYNKKDVTVYYDRTGNRVLRLALIRLVSLFRFMGYNEVAGRERRGVGQFYMSGRGQLNTTCNKLLCSTE
ncbi:hypothetical protein J6590_011399 [Homalodisca vitripennis]|nr:hypothetical protein J6590_011399 [Homalodisca vitripennis]